MSKAVSDVIIISILTFKTRHQISSVKGNNLKLYKKRCNQMFR